MYSYNMGGWTEEQFNNRNPRDLCPKCKNTSLTNDGCPDCGFFMKIETPEYRELVRLQDTEGDYCSRCGIKNDWWDDCGWFYASIELVGHEGPVCRECFYSLGCSTGER